MYMYERADLVGGKKRSMLHVPLLLLPSRDVVELEFVLSKRFRSSSGPTAALSGPVPGGWTFWDLCVILR